MRRLHLWTDSLKSDFWLPVLTPEVAGYYGAVYNVIPWQEDTDPEQILTAGGDLWIGICNGDVIDIPQVFYHGYKR